MHLCRDALAPTDSHPAHVRPPSTSGQTLQYPPRASRADAARQNPSTVDPKRSADANVASEQSSPAYPRSTTGSVTNPAPEAPNLAQPAVPKQQAWSGSPSGRVTNGWATASRANDSSATNAPCDMTNGQNPGGFGDQSPGTGAGIYRSPSGGRPGGGGNEWGPGSAPSPGRISAGSGPGAGAHPPSAPSPLRPVTNQRLQAVGGTPSPKPAGILSKFGRTASENLPSPSGNGASLTPFPHTYTHTHTHQGEGRNAQTHTHTHTHTHKEREREREREREGGREGDRETPGRIPCSSAEVIPVECRSVWESPVCNHLLGLQRLGQLH
jgi:hypothetical protein